MARYKAGEPVFVTSWDEGGAVVEDCDTGYWVRGQNFSDFVVDNDIEGVLGGGIGFAA